MFIYNDDFNEQVNKIVSEILPFKKAKFRITSTHKRLMKYVTDIDIVQVLPKYFSTLTNEEYGIKMQKIIKYYLKNIVTSQKDLIFVHLISGEDDRLRITNKDDLGKLFETKQIDLVDMDRFLKMSIDDVNSALTSYRKLRWTFKEIMNNSKFVNTREFKLSDTLSVKRKFVLVFAIFYGNYVYNYDIVCVDNSEKVKDLYEDYFLPMIRKVNDERYPFFILRMVGKIIGYVDPKLVIEEKPIAQEIENIIEVKLGAYKQMMVRAQLVQKLLLKKLLSENQLKTVYDSFRNDLKEMGEKDMAKVLTMKNPVQEMELLESEALREMNAKALPYLKQISAQLDPKLREKLILIDLSDF